MNMRKGFTLIEMIVIITVFPLVLITVDKLFKSLAGDIPRSCRVPQENALVMNMLEKLQKDVDLAKGLPESSGGYTAGEKLLLIEQADGVICYKIEDARILRYNLKDIDNKNEQTAWPLLNAEIQWQVRKINATGSAVEIKTRINYKIDNRTEKKLANSHLYFVGAF
jgi:hypothetical protein